MLGPDSILLTDRVAVVTGAGAGLGEAIALGLARFGCDLAVCDRDEATLESTVEAVRAMGRHVISTVIDVRDEDLVTEFVNRIVGEFARVDVLVNNVGGMFRQSFLDMSSRGQSAIVNQNFTSVTNFTRATVPHMTGGGSIINVTSIEAHRASPTGAVYGAMKAAVVSLSQSLALELGPMNIRVNCIAPDFIVTPGLGGIGVKPPWTAIPREGHLDDAIGAAVWLAGPMSGFVTGTTIHIDGGKLAAGSHYSNESGEFFSI